MEESNNLGQNLDKSYEKLHTSDVSNRFFGVLHDSELCKNENCECHTKYDKRFVTPFPIESGNPYCCMKCALRRNDY
jgi:hypothetical protein